MKQGGQMDEKGLGKRINMYHGSGYFLLVGRCTLPQFCQFPDFADIIIRK